ncbi:MAG: helix-turn-helix transcriptional regulator [Nanoarchaeota archaeon]
MVYPVYAVDCVDRNDKETGLVKTLSRFSENGSVLVPNYSILPIVSDITDRELTKDQKENVGATIDVVAGILASPNTYLIPQNFFAFKSRAERELRSGNGNAKQLQDWYSRFLEKLDRIEIFEMKERQKDIFKLFFEGFTFIEGSEGLDIVTKEELESDQQKRDRAFEDLSLISTLGVLSPYQEHALLTVDNLPLRIFSAFFRIAYTQAATERDIGNLDKIAKSIGNPRLNLTLCDYLSENQPFEIRGRTSDPNSCPFPENWAQIHSTDQTRIIVELRRYFSNISYHLNGKEEPKPEKPIHRVINSPKLSKPKLISEPRPKDIAIEKPEPPKKTVKLEEEILNVSKPIKGTDIERKRYLSLLGIKNQDPPGDIRKELSLEEIAREKVGSNGKISENFLADLYAGVRINPEEIPALFLTGALQRRLEVYGFLRERALKIKSEKVLGLMREDLKRISEYLRNPEPVTLSDLLQKTEKEKLKVPEYLALLEPLTAEMSSDARISETKRFRDSKPIVSFDSERAVRIRHGALLSQSQLGEKLGLAQGQISHLELGKIGDIRNLSLKTLNYFKWLFEQDGYNPFSLDFSKPQEGTQV